jgi:hypothetical protein
MTIAVCFKCGEFKHGAFKPCPKCGEYPLNDNERAKSIVLTDHNYSPDELKSFGDSIKRGAEPDTDTEITSSYQEALNSKTGSNIINTIRSFEECKRNESAERLANNLIAIYGNEEISDLYVKLYSEDAPEIKRFFFSSYIFIIIASILAVKVSKREEVAIQLAECHKFMFKWWDAQDSIVAFTTYIITNQERERLLKIIKTHDDLDIDPQSLNRFQLPFEVLLRHTMLIRFQILSDDLIRAYSEATNGEVDFEGLFLDWAIKMQGFITEDTISHTQGRNYNKVRDTLQIMNLKQVLRQYYDGVWNVFKGE